MKNLHFIFAFAAVAMLSTGCATNYGAGSPYQPGPVIGKTVGNAVGVVGGNVAGLGVGLGEGAVHGVASTFDRKYHMVREWKTVTTADGRTVQVPEDILVDQYGQPAAMPAPTGNPAPPAQQQPPASSGNLNQPPPVVTTNGAAQ